MAELKQVFEIVTNQIEPDAGAWKQLEQRRRRVARNRKMRAMAVAAAVAIGAALFAERVLDLGSDGSAPASVAPSASGVALRVVDLDGSIRSSITGLPEGAAMPEISPDGSRVAFSLTARQGEVDGLGSQIAVMNLDGTESRTITKGRRLSDEWPRWSPDGTRLLFYRLLSYRSQATNGRGYGRLMVINADGTNAHVIRGARSPEGGAGAWSPDGSLVLYTSAAGGQQHLETIPVTGGRPDRFTRSRLEESGGTWSPDGLSVAFVRQVSVGITAPTGLTHQLMDQIWLMNADGSHKHVLAGLPDAHAEGPEWSPDGSMIAFIGSTYGIGGAERDSDSVYVVNVSTGEITRVLSGIAVGMGHDSHATWLPDGYSLLVVTKTP